MKPMKAKPRKHSPDQKVSILRQHLLDQRSVSELCQEYQLHPNVFYRWQKEFFEGGAAAFDKASSSQLGRLQREIEALQGQLASKNEVLAEVMEAYVRLKKSVGGL